MGTIGLGQDFGHPTGYDRLRDWTLARTGCRPGFLALLAAALALWGAV